MLRLPSDTNTLEIPLLKMGYDESGILYLVYNKLPVITLEEVKQAAKAVQHFLNGRKCCILMDVTNIGEMRREVREYVAEIIRGAAKAIAIVSDSVLGRMVANLFFSIKPQPYPVEMFDDITTAKNWLMKYLSHE